MEMVRNIIVWVAIGLGSAFCLLLVFLFALPCYEYWFGFDQQSWLRHASIQNCNPRSSMVTDLMLHHLPSGTSRQTVIGLLGAPYEDENEIAQRNAPRMPASLTGTDSLLKGPLATAVPKQQPQVGLGFTQGHTPMPTQQDTLLRYPVSLNISDPDFLVIHLSPQGRVVGYHIQRH